VQHLARDTVLGRELFLLDLSTPEDLPELLSLPSKHFACLVAWDSTAATADQITHFARRLLQAGAVVVCAWGPDCRRVHDLTDLAAESLQLNTGSGSVMTSWFPDESLSEAIWFVLMSSWPDEAYEETCGSTIATVIGSPVWSAEIRSAFSEPGNFVDSLP
jgi:hypothetical protein